MSGLAIVGVGVGVGVAAPPVAAVDYLQDVRPLLAARCYPCHGSLKQESGLRLDSGALIRQGGDSGAAVLPGRAEESLLVARIEVADEFERMPPEGEPLTAEQIAVVRAWIAEGAVSPENEHPERHPSEHWAFQPPVKAPLPEVDHASWVLNPIDAFVAAAQARRGLGPAPAADRATWLRRVYLDLIGLPPTRGELHAFLADDSPEAYSNVVDALLASPRYGERWGRHWMDVWRYSDWYGRRSVPDVWNSAPQIWRWRDWIVRSLNADKGYDRMVAEMLAADEIAPENDQTAVATGFLIRNWYALNPNDWMRSNVEHTGKAFLGLTFNCAHCHDHKYDPISHEDYFRMRAFFEPIGIRQARVAGEGDPGPFQEYEYSALRKVQPLGMVRIYDQNAAAPTWFYSGGDERNRDESRGSISPGVPEIFAEVPLNIEPVSLPPTAWYPGLRPEIQAAVLEEHQVACAASANTLATAREAAETAQSPLRRELQTLESTFAAGCLTAAQSGQIAAPLAGQQSLWIDATTGRQLLHNSLSQLSSFPEGMTIRFQLKILSDTHFNFQLAKDVALGHTAAAVIFDGGRLVSYLPGTFTEFEVGRYDVSGGANRFEVELVLYPKTDLCQLTVRSTGLVADERVLVDAVPVALNGWNPVGDDNQPISFDIRPGSAVGIDDVELIDRPANGVERRLAYFDFEAPRYPVGSGVIGHDGWFGSAMDRPPAVSAVSLPIANDALREMWQNLHAARRGIEAEVLKVRAAEARHIAAEAQRTSVIARIAADRSRFLSDARSNAVPAGKPAETDALVHKAIRREREAALRTAEAEVMVQEQALAAAEARAVGDAERTASIETATKQLAAARASSRCAAAVAAAAVTVEDNYTPFSPIFPKTSTGRRLALARWIADRQNPLTARVAVNHIWMRHFHSPLVETVFDLGRSGEAPTHPELLDWLAVELMDSGWKMKHLHRLITLSNTYRMASSHPAVAAAANIDPDNKRLWKMNVGRMEAEVARDSLLYCARRLDSRMGGQELENDRALTTYRRTLYYSCHPEVGGKSAFGAIFDAPEPGECYRRTRSILPQQALAMTNSELVHQLSGELSAAIWIEVADDPRSPLDAFVVNAFERILSRPPRETELTVCVNYLVTAENHEQVSGAAPDAARLASLVRALLNHNDFIAIR